MDDDDSDDDNNNLKELSANEYRDLTNALKDTKIMSTLVEYYEQVQQFNKDNNNESDTITQTANVVPSTSTSTSTSTSSTSTSTTTTTTTQTQTPTPPTSLNDLPTKSVITSPAFCIKTHSNRHDVVYVMVSHYYSIEPASTTDNQGWIIPHALFPLQQQKSSYASNIFNVYHIVYATETYNEAMKNRGLNRLLVQTAVKAIHQSTGESLNIAAYKISKKSFKREMVVSILPEPEVVMDEPAAKETVNEDGTIIPIKLEILLSRLESITNLYIEVIDQQLVLQEPDHRYNMQYTFHHKIDEDNIITKFNKRTKLLTITATVLEDHSHSHSHSQQSGDHSHHGSDHVHHHEDTLDMIKRKELMIDMSQDTLPFSTTNVEATSMFPSYLYRQTHEKIWIIIHIGESMLLKDTLQVVVDDDGKGKDLSITYLEQHGGAKVCRQFNLHSDVSLDSVTSQQTIVIRLNKTLSLMWPTLERTS
ncbi:hypothetical protein SAMD00019534_031250 [Acytostelium subglobosum LB1]|uniref:hypothetical protein n=1 Tax=Acytostelium subglobosum LB1 TaxID=1410327 RepID=UPI0006447DAA|nr:hypothetical protein SAMD00019534_031250 [Acytostelium subglobosum LB1]GAM19950.1 hypothetical protein SAMD00019534_031250 [Acytostelium subglobosum LB1]|eukprot:XP_012756712.1 hypothetical protein SAMD00019534_031250 [Acytostelium subglobosum LB1]